MAVGSTVKIAGFTITAASAALFPVQSPNPFDVASIIGDWDVANAVVAGGLVSSLPNNAGGADMSAAGVGQPTYSAVGGPGGLPCAVFDGAANFMQTIFPLAVQVQPVTVYLLLNKTSFNAGGAARVFGDPTVQGHCDVEDAGASPGIRQVAGANGAVDGDLSLGVWHVLCASFNGASSLLQVDNNAPVATSPGANGPSGLQIAAAAIGGFSAMSVARCLAYGRADSPTQIAAAMAAFHGVYGVP